MSIGEPACGCAHLSAQASALLMGCQTPASLRRRGVFYSVGLGNYSSPYYICPLQISVEVVVDCTAVTRAALVRMIIVAAHESSADGAFAPVAWTRVVRNDN